MIFINGLWFWMSSLSIMCVLYVFCWLFWLLLWVWLFCGFFLFFMCTSWKWSLLVVWVVWFLCVGFGGELMCGVSWLCWERLCCWLLGFIFFLLMDEVWMILLCACWSLWGFLLLFGWLWYFVLSLSFGNNFGNSMVVLGCFVGAGAPLLKRCLMFLMVSVLWFLFKSCCVLCLCSLDFLGLGSWFLVLLVKVCCWWFCLWFFVGFCFGSVLVVCLRCP